MESRKKVWDGFLHLEYEDWFNNYAKLIYEVVHSDSKLEDCLFSHKEAVSSVLVKLCDILHEYIHECPDCNYDDEPDDIEKVFPSLRLGPNTFLDLPRTPYRGIAGITNEAFYWQFLNHSVLRKKILDLSPCPCLYEHLKETSTF